MKTDAGQLREQLAAVVAWGGNCERFYRRLHVLHVLTGISTDTLMEDLKTDARILRSE